MAAYRQANNLPQRNVTVKVSELRSKLEENRTLHAKEYGEAVEEYKKAAKVALIEKKRELDKKVKEVLVALETNPVEIELPSLSIDVHPPTSYDEAYDEVIAMFAAEVNETVELSSQEFARYFRNKWEWSDVFASTKLSYSKYLLG